MWYDKAFARVASVTTNAKINIRPKRVAVKFFLTRTSEKKNQKKRLSTSLDNLQKNRVSGIWLFLVDILPPRSSRLRSLSATSCRLFEKLLRQLAILRALFGSNPV